MIGTPGVGEGGARRPSRLGRRAVARGAAILGVLAATAIAGIAGFGPVAAASAPEVVWRVISDNATLVPATLARDHVYTAGETAAEAWTRDGALAWRTPLAAPAHFRPRVADGRLVAVGRDGLAVLDASDGAVLWAATPRAAFGAPFVHDGRLVLGDGSDVVAFALADGRPLWRYTVSGAAKVHYAPTAIGDTVYLGAGDGLLTALDAATGAVRWTVDRGDLWQYLRQLAPTADGRVLVAGGYKDELFGLDPADGRILWRHRAGNFINSQLVHDGRVFFWSPTGWMVALDARSGRRLWRTRTHRFGHDGAADWSMVLAAPRAGPARLWVLDMAAVLHGLDLEDGAEVATVVLPFPARPFVTPLADRAGDVIVGSLGGELARLRVPDLAPAASAAR
nr:PQQ-binding-like beta-propeller repeat protein [Roseospira goensis]